MIQEVNFEIAKLLKEKGFNSYSTSQYIQFNSSDDGWKLKTNQEYNNLDCEIGIGDNLRISAPTIAEVVTWLYEKHGIWIECLHRGDMGDFTFKISKLKKGWRTEPHYIHESGYNSPTEAYEAGITHVLENLI